MNENARHLHLMKVNNNEYISNAKYESQLNKEDYYDMIQSIGSEDDIVENKSAVNEGLGYPYQTKRDNSDQRSIAYNINQYSNVSNDYSISSISSEGKNNKDETITQFLDNYNKDMHMIDNIIKSDDKKPEEIRKLLSANSSASISGLLDN